MHTMHLLPSVAIQPNLELKTQPKQLLGSLPLVIAHPDEHNQIILDSIPSPGKKQYIYTGLQGAYWSGQGVQTQDLLLFPFYLTLL